MIPTMRSYTPGLYQPAGFGRYRQYPRQVVTPIPGAGFSNVKKMVWAEQELNLDGGAPQDYGNYSTVPLRGLGSLSIPMLSSNRSLLPLFLTGGQNQGGPAPTETAPEGRAPTPPDPSGYMIDGSANLPPLTPPPVPESVGPMIPWWAWAAGATAVAGAGAWWLWRRKS